MKERLIKRFFINPEHVEQEWIFLKDQEYHHAVRVLRLKEKDIFDAIDGQGLCYRAEVNAITKDYVRCAILKRDVSDRSQTVPLSLALAVSKEKAMSLMLQKAVELGICSLYLYWSERSQGRCDGKVLLQKKERWLKILKDAAKQSGNDHLPSLHVFETLAEALREAKSESFSELIVLSPWSNQSLIEFDQKMRDLSEADSPCRVIAFLGPEGGLTSQEESLLSDQGARALKCGELLMRVETAMMFIASSCYLWNLYHEQKREN